MQCGRVGSRLFSNQSVHLSNQVNAFFIYLLLPNSSDGTPCQIGQCGRVGSRLFSYEAFIWAIKWTLFCLYAIYSFQACRACTFDRPGLATIGAYPGCVCRAGTYAIGIVLFLNSFVQKEYHSRINPFIAGKWAKHEKRKYNPQGGSIFACVITQGSLLSSATSGYRK